jgi:hypothetical protein
MGKCSFAFSRGERFMGENLRVYKGVKARYTADVVRAMCGARNPPRLKIQTLEQWFPITGRQARIEA